MELNTNPIEQLSFGQRLRQAKQELRRAARISDRKTAEPKLKEAKPPRVTKRELDKIARAAARAAAAELKAKEKAQVAAKKDAERKAKEILLARKIKKLEEQQYSRHQENSRKKSGSNSRGIFKTIPFTTAGKIPVQIDSKTIIYVKEGADIQAAISKFANRHTTYSRHAKSGVAAQNSALKDFNRF